MMRYRVYRCVTEFAEEKSVAICTHGHHETVLRSHSWRTAANSAAYLFPHLRHTDHLLDIGAGPGTITADFANSVAQVTATEVGECELDLSRATIAGRGLGNVDFSVQDIHHLTFQNNSFDVTHAHQVLQHVADPIQALREMARVTRPGGLVAARDSDYAGFAWWPRLSELDEWLRLYRAATRANGGEPDAGRRLLSWARAAGLSDTTPSSSTWCYATAAECAWWGGMWADRILESGLARQLVDDGHATPADLRRISSGWRAWAESEDGWLSVLHGEILCRLPEP
jgi:SAM-dependent methyltransferase